MTASPALSVIIPTYNRAPVLDRCLHALAKQRCRPDEFEVLVSDDGSSDGTRDVVETFAARGAFRLRYLAQSNSGANRARNRAAQAARAPLLLFINDDTIPTPLMLQEHLEGHVEHPEPGVAVLGRVTVSPELPPSRLAALHLDRAFTALAGRTDLDWRSFFTCNISLKKALLEQGELFEEGIRYHEDLELSERLSHRGLRVVYRPAALGYHHHFLTEDEFLAVACREARALAIWARKSPHLLPALAEFGFESALPLPIRVKHSAAGLIFNRWSNPLWRVAARGCPMEFVSLKMYEQVYQSVKRRELRRIGRGQSEGPNGKG
jgi:glycosyltransferase involved in cell wall biosynthesis